MRSALDAVGELRHLVVDGPPLRHQRADLAVGVHHRGVVAAAEVLPDFRQRQVGELAAQVHRDLCRDHTTVMHADRKIRSLMAGRRAVYNQVTELTNRIKSQAR